MLLFKAFVLVDLAQEKMKNMTCFIYHITKASRLTKHQQHAIASGIF